MRASASGGWGCLEAHRRRWRHSSVFLAVLLCLVVLGLHQAASFSTPWPRAKAERLVAAPTQGAPSRLCGDSSLRWVPVSAHGVLLPTCLAVLTAVAIGKSSSVQVGEGRSSVPLGETSVEGYKVLALRLTKATAGEAAEAAKQAREAAKAMKDAAELLALQVSGASSLSELELEEALGEELDEDVPLPVAAAAASAAAPSPPPAAPAEPPPRAPPVQESLPRPRRAADNPNLVVTVPLEPQRARPSSSGPGVSNLMQQGHRDILGLMTRDGWQVEPLDSSGNLFQVTMPAVRYDLGMGVVSIPPPVFLCKVRESRRETGAYKERLIGDLELQNGKGLLRVSLKFLKRPILISASGSGTCQVGAEGTFARLAGHVQVGLQVPKIPGLSQLMEFFVRTYANQSARECVDALARGADELFRAKSLVAGNCAC